MLWSILKVHLCLRRNLLTPHHSFINKGICSVPKSRSRVQSHNHCCPLMNTSWYSPEHCGSELTTSSHRKSATSSQGHLWKGTRLHTRAHVPHTHGQCTQLETSRYRARSQNGLGWKGPEDHVVQPLPQGVTSTSSGCSAPVQPGLSPSRDGAAKPAQYFGLGCPRISC